MTPTAWSVVALMAVGAAALLTAGLVGAREEAAGRGRRGRGLAPLVPWVGTALIVALLVRGSAAGAAFVAAVVAVHAATTRWRATRRP